MTDAELDAARSELKQRVSGTRKKRKAQHWEQQFELRGSSDRRFRLFKRWNSTLPNVFSVGLDLVLDGGESLNLCRYNGAYHAHRNRIEGNRVPATFHIHTTKAHYIAAGLSPDGYAEASDRYNTVEGALRCLLKDCNITGVAPSDDDADESTPDLFEN